MIRIKDVSLRACSICNGIPGKWNEWCFGCGHWILLGFGTDGNRYALSRWASAANRPPGVTLTMYVGKPSFDSIRSDLVAAASEHFTLPGEPDVLALRVLRATEPKVNFGRGFAA